jgi:hypothetical protein
VKLCRRCGQTKPRSDFYLSVGRGGDGRRAYCKKCDSALSMAYFKEHPDAARRSRRNAWWRKWGAKVDHEWYDEMLSAQEWCCASCGDSLLEMRPQQVHVDHDHLTGEGRGVLCGRCNIMMGMALDSVHRLLLGADYLASFCPRYEKQE